MSILCILLCGFITAPNVHAATLHQENTQYYYDRYYPDGSEHSWYYKHYTMDNEVAYCIEPGVVEGVNYPQTNYSATGLPNSIKERILLIGYYGYTYPGHNTEKYRMATQGKSCKKDCLLCGYRSDQRNFNGENICPSTKNNCFA